MSTNPQDSATKFSETKITLDLNELNEGELAYLKSQTGIQDMDELKRHVEDIAERAFKIFGYRYLTRTIFLKSKYIYQPMYKHVLELPKTRKDAIFLDIGCGFGHDTRKAIADGYPVQNMVACDLHPEFWALGHELFNSTPETFPVPFVPGDALDNVFIPECPSFTDKNPLSTEKPSQSTLASSKTLAPLQGHVSAIHAAALFHLFLESQQRVLAKKLASLLSPVPGSVLFGIHRGHSQPAEYTNFRGETVFCHSPESWKRLWVGGEGEEGMFPKGTVEVNAELVNPRLGTQTGSSMLVWSVKRI